MLSVAFSAAVPLIRVESHRISVSFVPAGAVKPSGLTGLTPVQTLPPVVTVSVNGLRLAAVSLPAIAT